MAPKTAKKIMNQSRRPGRKDVMGIPGYLSVEHMAELLGSSKQHVYRHAGKDLPPLHPVAGLKRFRLSEVEAWQAAGERWPLPTGRTA